MEKVEEKQRKEKLQEWVKSNVGKKVMGTIALSILGVALPQVFHVLAGSSAGATFLPMHISVLMAAMLFGALSGSVVAGTSIFFSYALTGMPTLARLPYMLIELVIYAVLLGVLNKKFPAYVSLIATVILGRLFYAAVLWVAANGLGLSLAGISNVWQAFVAGIPGIVVQLACIPAIVKLTKKGLKLDE